MPLKPLPASADLGLLALRLWIGVVGMLHGSQKIFTGEGIKGFAGFLEKLNVPAPAASAWMAALSELVGGAMIALGLWPRIAAVPFAITMIVAWATAHKGAFFAQTGGGEYPLTLAVIALAIAVAGPGSFAITRSKGA
jgi:putative oxidoreductase